MYMMPSLNKVTIDANDAKYIIYISMLMWVQIHLKMYKLFGSQITLEIRHFNRTIKVGEGSAFEVLALLNVCARIKNLVNK